MVRYLLFCMLITSCTVAKKDSSVSSELLKKNVFSVSEICDSQPKCVWSQNFSGPRDLSIMQGPTSDQFTQLSVTAPRELQLAFFVSNGVQVHRVIEAKKVSWSDHGYAVWHLPVEQFGGPEEYKLIVISEDQKILDVRKFAFVSPKSSSARVILASCMDDSFVSSMQKNWQKILELSPDAILMMGDNVYVDKWGEQKLNVQSGDDIWKRYVDNRRAVPLFKFEKLIPVYATWDDHDYAKNDGDETWALKDVSFKVFRAFFPQPLVPGVYSPGPGVSGHLTLAGISWLLLDVRSFRSQNTTREAGEIGQTPLTHFGLAQERWMNEKSQRSPLPQFWVSGDQWFGNHHSYESFENNHPKKFDATLESLKKEKRKIIFVSGDRHISEIQKIPTARLGYQTYEITSSPIHGKFTPGILKKYHSPLSVVESEGASQFMLMTVKSSGRAVSIDIENWTDTRGRSFTWSEVIQ